jgi:2'-5' RNA ligase
VFPTGLEHLVATKISSVARSPRQRFTYVPLPPDLVARWSRLQSRILPAGATKQDIDHITLVYVPKAAEDIGEDTVDDAVNALREVGAATPPIEAKVQGWAYFDGAEKDGEPATALVALVDAPGLAELYVEMKSALVRVGMPAASNHGFTPHITFGYLKQGERVRDLPQIEGTFTIEKVCFANADIHEVQLSGSLGVKAAMTLDTIGSVIGRTLEANPDRLVPFLGRMRAIGSPKALLARTMAVQQSRAHFAGTPQFAGTRTGNRLAPVAGTIQQQPSRPGPAPRLDEPSVEIRLACERLGPGLLAPRWSGGDFDLPRGLARARKALTS